VARYVLIADDSGNREYDDQQDYEHSGKSRYFVYGAILMEERESLLYIARLQELKKLTFATADVEVKSNWLRMPTERQVRYLDRFGISEATLTGFVDGYYRLIQQAPLKLVGAIVDKLHMQQTYKSPWYAPTAAYEVLLQRAVQAIPAGAALTVTMDEISGRTPKRNEYKILLADHHSKIRRFGSSLQKGISFKAIDGPVKFTNSATSDLVQVADVAAYNLYRQFKDYGAQWEQQIARLPLYEHFSRIAHKFYQGAGGRIQGFGVVKFPLKTQIRWRVKPDGKEKP
jgi:hypothetical protein